MRLDGRHGTFLTASIPWSVLIADVLRGTRRNSGSTIGVCAHFKEEPSVIGRIFTAFCSPRGATSPKSSAAMYSAWHFETDPAHATIRVPP
uniref:Uncharacterized protein n=1 Tax=viral metagenome TaxID=1070528 RepID=A0A6C0C151_9ZZZZ